MRNVARYRVVIIESECGWGSKVDSIKYFPATDKGKLAAEKYMRDFNKPNNKPIVPDWYMAAQLPELVVVDLDTL